MKEGSIKFIPEKLPGLPTATHQGMGGRRSQAQSSKVPSTRLPNSVALPLYKSTSLSPLGTPSVGQTRAAIWGGGPRGFLHRDPIHHFNPDSKKLTSASHKRYLHFRGRI